MNAQERYAQSHQCPDCGPTWILQIRWNNYAKSMQIWCTHCGRTNDFVKRKSDTQLWRENPDLVPLPMANRLAEQHRDEIEAVAEGLPEDLGQVVRAKYFGHPIPIKQQEEGK